MSIKTKAFWLQVKEEYDPAKVFLCSSPSFREEWFGEGRDTIRELASQYTDITIGKFFLFLDGNIRNPTIRQGFVDWCINNLN